MTIPRYRQWCQTTHRHEMLADPQGDWLRLADVMAWAEQGRAELAATQDANLHQAATIARLDEALGLLQRDYDRMLAAYDTALATLAHWQAHGVLHEDTSPVD